MKLEAAGRGSTFGKRIDFHTHILPVMDDGSSSVEMSMQMIQTSLAQGVSCIVLTPHFYAGRDYPKHFLQKRAARMDLLKQHHTNRIPLIISGAEVQYFEGITSMKELRQMRIEKTRGLLVEMPMGKWSGRMISDIVELNNRSEYQVILAHVERYLSFRNLPEIRQLASAGVFMQVSADAFTGLGSSGKMLKLLDEGLVHLLGSDCHNMTTRPPNLADAYTILEKKRGEAVVAQIVNNGIRLLTESPPESAPYAADMEYI